MVPALAVNDQHGKEFVFTNSVRFLVVATEKACGTAASHKLAEQGAGFLEKHQAVYVMDIHTMPSVARVFALTNPNPVIRFCRNGAGDKIAGSAQENAACY